PPRRSLLAPTRNSTRRASPMSSTSDCGALCLHARSSSARAGADAAARERRARESVVAGMRIDNLVCWGAGGGGRRARALRGAGGGGRGWGGGGGGGGGGVGGGRGGARGRGGGGGGGGGARARRGAQVLDGSGGDGFARACPGGVVVAVARAVLDVAGRHRRV